ncbi:MAG TPA: hypothetical protein ACQGQI_03830 [Xylella sp.]
MHVNQYSGLTQQRISDLMHDKINSLVLDALGNMMMTVEHHFTSPFAWNSLTFSAFANVMDKINP